MADNLSKEDRIKTMRAVKSKGTGPERRLRAMMAGLGLGGWRVNPEDVIGKPDFAFPDKKIAIFVDGCFWHGCPVCDRPLPQTNREYWERKISRNIDRDRQHTALLQAAGWKVVRFWGHQLGKSADLTEVAQTLTNLLHSTAKES